MIYTGFELFQHTDPTTGQVWWIANYIHVEGKWSAMAIRLCPLEALAQLAAFLVKTYNWPLEQKQLKGL